MASKKRSQAGDSDELDVSKEEVSGDIEPVSVDQFISRDEIGHSEEKGITGDLTTRIRKCVENYAKSDNNGDLVFSPDFTKEERALIHEHAKEFGLRSRSRKKANRFLTLSRPEDPTVFRVDKYRDQDECALAWRLRRRFLVAHHDKFPEARLVCLAKCFINVEMDGCSYPDPVMIQLKELSKDFPKLVKQKKERVKMKYATMGFVKASDSDNTEPEAKKSLSDIVTEPLAGSEMGVIESLKSGLHQSSIESQMGFVKSGAAYKSTNIQADQQAIAQSQYIASIQEPHCTMKEHRTLAKKKPQKKKKSDPDNNVDEYDQTFARLRHEIKKKSVEINPISLLNMVIHKVKMTVRSSIDGKEVGDAIMYECKVSIDFIHIASAVDRTKKLAKKAAFENAIQEILKPYHTISFNDDDSKELHAYETPFLEEEELEEPEVDEIPMLPAGETWYESNAGGLHTQRIKGYNSKNRPLLGDSAKSLDEFILVSDTMNTKAVQHPGALLRQSADFSKMLLEFEFVRNKDGVSCRVSLEGQPLVECTAKTKLLAKYEASENAIDLLKEMCWTIKFKQAADSDELCLSKEEVLGDVEKVKCEIPDSNIGNKMLRKMGWVGGGVGKNGTGRAEPVLVEQVIKRAGIGHSKEKGMSGDTMNRIRKCVENYARSDNYGDLVFSSDFTKEERALIHQHAKRFRLKTRSRGSNANRFIIVSRKRTAVELFEHVMSQGGSTSKYELVPPQC
ncbi:uncharacterized protein LOC124139321 [Haliotis rufescens]|uniref:uncharacterized protein LOC124139321 n=1 Tax=Haliotis rufescens TaxID=6454 RepID=UPI00201E7F15|nr:uncharacterized protein LOC124139321 [Haliotis rufescens]